MVEKNRINPNINEPITSLYLHVPFCTRKCGYCDYYSKTTESADFEVFYKGLKKELEQTLQYLDKNKNCVEKLKTFYIGGGTPSTLPTQTLAKIVYLLKYEIGLASDCEFTIEVNPEPIGHPTLIKAIELGANRISLGYQAKQDRLLKRIGRLHSFQDFLDTLKIIEAQGIENISSDLMFGLPGQSLEDALLSAQQLIDLKIPHISFYSLILEKGTLFHHQYKDNLELLPSEDLERSMYSSLLDLFTSSAYQYYELSSVGKAGYYSRHNYNYWSSRPYLGIGPAAHSYFNGIRKGNARSLKEWQADPWSSSEIEEIDYDLAMREYMMLTFRLAEGFSPEKFKKRFKKPHPFPKEIERLLERKLIMEIDSKSSYKLTLKGLDLANQVFIEFI